MTHYIRVFVLAAIGCSVLPGQAPSVPAQWEGVWTLSLAESTFGPILTPGFPNGLTVTSETLRFTVSAGELKGAGDTVTTQFGSSHDGFEVRLDGKETKRVLAPGATISTRLVDDATFVITIKVDRDGVGVNRFVLDGKKLTETKTHTESKREGAKTSTSILVFYKTPGSK